jgi:hypothetical protein
MAYDGEMHTDGAALESCTCRANNGVAKSGTAEKARPMLAPKVQQAAYSAAPTEAASKDPHGDVKY